MFVKQNTDNDWIGAVFSFQVFLKVFKKYLLGLF